MRCEQKHQYSTYQRARQAAAMAMKRVSWPLRVYKCPLCRGWHMTKQPKRNPSEA